MKHAAERLLAGDSKTWIEETIGKPMESRLRVDVSYRKNKRFFLVECETKPNTKRLIDKGKRRNRLGYRTTYILIVPVSNYRKNDWSSLRGYFDIIYAYDEEHESFTQYRDLRFLGPLQDRLLNLFMPIYKSRHLEDLYWFIMIRKNRVKWALREIIQCNACRIGIDTIWEYCPTMRCPYFELHPHTD
jgi:hypothetical protein